MDPRQSGLMMIPLGTVCTIPGPERTWPVPRSPSE